MLQRYAEGVTVSAARIVDGLFAWLLSPQDNSARAWLPMGPTVSVGAGIINA